MSQLTDETLVAMADGALSLEERIVVERELATDHQSLRFLLLLRLSAIAIREAFAGHEFDRVPERLRQLLLRRPGPGTSILGACGRLTMARTFRTAAAGAATLVLAAGTLLVVGLDRPGRHSHAIELGTLDSDSELAMVLDRQQNGRFVPASAANDRLVVVASIRDRFGNPCHEIDVYSGSKDAADELPDVLLACRTARGSWAVIAAAAAAELRQASLVPPDEMTRGALKGVMAMIGTRDEAAPAEKEN